MKIVLTGATGFTGGEVLRQALVDPAVEQVTVLTRRALGFTHDKLMEVIQANFLDYSSLDFCNYDACIWCLGVSQSEVSKDEYIRITLEYTVAAAQAMYTNNPRLRFCFVSGRSADPMEKGASLFSRIKGRTEQQLMALGGPLFIFRPGYIRPTTKSGPRKDLARLFAPIGTFLSILNKNFSVDCDQLAHCLLEVARHGSYQSLWVNRSIREWKHPPDETRLVRDGAPR